MTKAKSEILYKVTTPNGFTRNDTYWEVGTTHQVKWGGQTCHKGCLHAYRSPILAAMLAPYHTGRGVRRLFKAKGVVRLERGDKVGCARLTILEEISMPSVSSEDRVRLAILCARETPKGKANPTFQTWAENWLSGKDRTYGSAQKCWITTVTPTATATEMAMAMATAMATQMPTANYLSRTLVDAYEETNGEIDIPALAEKAVQRQQL